jgi:replication fork protection complex subunit Tof1/Swi1
LLRVTDWRQLGGTSIEEHGRYVLGDDALACLKDLRRWIKFYDQKLNRLDVHRVLAESNLVKGDLLEILAVWPEDAADDQLKSKTALACRKVSLDFQSYQWLTRISGALGSFDLAIGY